MKALENCGVNCSKPDFEIFQGPFHRNLKTGTFHFALCQRVIDNKQSSAQNLCCEKAEPRASQVFSPRTTLSQILLITYTGFRQVHLGSVWKTKFSKQYWFLAFCYFNCTEDYSTSHYQNPPIFSSSKYYVYRELCELFHGWNRNQVLQTCHGKDIRTLQCK